METYSHLFDYAVQIEEHGMLFYQSGAKRTENDTLRLLFNYLAEEETHHKQRFIQLRSEAQHWEVVPASAQANMKFLQAFVQNVVFNDDAALDRDLLHSERDLLRFALRRESESLLYYEEIRKLFGREAGPVLDRIIEEEIQHYLKLSDLLEKLTARDA